MSFFSELRRRNVFKVGAAYAIVAWLLVQVADVVLPALQAPEWTISFITVLLIIGFPITLIMAWAFDVTPQGIQAASAAKVGDAPVQPTVLRFGYISQGLILLAVGFLVVDQYVLSPQVENSARQSTTFGGYSRAVRRSIINLGPTQPLGVSGQHAQIALSRDARRLVYAANVEGRTQLYLRELDQLEARAIPGTESAANPFLSPDGEWVGFRANGILHRVSLLGGPTQPLVSGSRAGTGSFWTQRGTIFFTAQHSEGLHRLQSIPAVGGVPEPQTINTDRSEFAHSWPHVLPDGVHVLFSIRPNNGNMSEGRVALLSLQTGESRVLVEGAYNARYASTGHIVFMRSASLWAMPFDLERLEKLGDEVPVVEGVQTFGPRGDAGYAFSDDGLLIYVPGANTDNQASMTLVWVNRENQEDPLNIEPGSYLEPRLSPDGNRLAYRSIDSEGNRDLWIYDLARDVSTRLTFFEGEDRVPTWSPDGQQIVYWSEREEPGLFSKSADGTGEPLRLTTAENSQRPSSFSPDGQQLHFSEQGADGGASAYTLSLGENQTPELLLPGIEFRIEGAVVSPDERWIAYTSDETGDEEIYIRPFPNINDTRERVSQGGGEEPIWSPDGREIIYRNGGTLFVVSVGSGPEISLARPEVLITGNYSSADVNTYDISPDGQRLLMLQNPVAEAYREETSLVVVENWFEELIRFAPPSE